MYTTNAETRVKTAVQIVFGVYMLLQLYVVHCLLSCCRCPCFKHGLRASFLPRLFAGHIVRGWGGDKIHEDDNDGDGVRMGTLTVTGSGWTEKVVPLQLCNLNQGKSFTGLILSLSTNGQVADTTIQINAELIRITLTHVVRKRCGTETVQITSSRRTLSIFSLIQIR